MQSDKLSIAERHSLPVDLCSRDEEKRRHSAALVGAEFDKKARAGGSAWPEYQKSLNSAIFQLTDSTTLYEQLGGLLLIEELTPLSSEDNATKVTNFANYLRRPITSSDSAVLTMATRCLGLLARSEGGHAAVKPELERALQRLQMGNQLESAVLVLCQLAKHAPT